MVKIRQSSSEPAGGSEHPHRVDLNVGARLRLRRMYLGMSQEKVAQALGITFQQIQKYESATNRVSASRLYQLAELLGVPVGFFFEGMEADLAEGRPAQQSAPEGAEAFDAEIMRHPTTLRLISRFYRIKDENLRTEVLALLRILGKPKA